MVHDMEMQLASLLPNLVGNYAVSSLEPSAKRRSLRSACFQRPKRDVAAGGAP